MKQKTVLLILLAIIVTGIIGYRYWPMKHMPMGSMKMGTMHSAGKALATVRVPELSAAAKPGEMLFNANCASCHGKDAAGQEGVAPPLVHKIYEPNHHGDIAFQRAAKNGARAHHWPFGDMPPVDGVTEADVTKIITYIRELQRANGIL